jgi:exoribonuclease R
MERSKELSISNNRMIVGILELTSKTKYGMTSRNHPLYLFRPLDSSLPLAIVGCSEKTPKSNVLALVRVEEWMKDTLTRGELVRILGPCGDPSAELLSLEYR